MGFLSDIGNAIASGVGAVGDAIEGAVDAITGAAGGIFGGLLGGLQDIFGGINNWLCRHTGNIGCRIGNVILGGLSGLIEGIRDLIDHVLQILQIIGSALSDLLHGDFAGFLGALAELILEIIATVIDAIRFIILGPVVGGIRDAWEADDLRQFVEGLLKQTYGAEPSRLAAIRERLNLDGMNWGFDLGVTHRVFRLDSERAPLWQWHNQGLIDLYSMAGYISFNSFKIQRSRTLVRSVDGATESSFPIRRWKLARYIDSEGKDGHVRVYALTIPALRDYIRVAKAKHKKLGVKLAFDQEYLLPYPSILAHDISTSTELNFDRTMLGQYLNDKGLRTSKSSQCNMLSLAAFRLIAGLGQVSGRNISEGEDAIPCTTPGRDDSCCITVDRNGSEGPGLIYWERWPSIFTRYVLAHEGGHYLGLCHYGHDGFQHIMFTPNKKAGLNFYNNGMWWHYYLNNEPTFSLKDAKNVWRFLVAEMSDCLEGKPIGEPTIL